MRRITVPAALLALLVAGPGCTFGVDTESGRFLCDTDDDCGSGWECGESGECFAEGECGATELCNEQDDDCDGDVDEGFDLQTDDQNCGACGNVCGGGSNCVTGKCIEQICDDDADNDDDTLTDCEDSDCDGATCGPNDQVCSEGACICSPPAGEPQVVERICDDGVDNDCDGLVDCEEDTCEGLACDGGVCSGGVCS